jgi:hypothetical protein
LRLLTCTIEIVWNSCKPRSGISYVAAAAVSNYQANDTFGGIGIRLCICFVQWWRFTNIKSADLAARWRIRWGLPIRRPTVAQRQNIMKFRRKSLFYWHFMPLIWTIFWIFPSSLAEMYPGLYCHTNIRLISWSTICSICHFASYIDYFPFSWPAREARGSRFLALF